MKTIRRVALLEPSVASECVVTEMMGQIRCGAPFLAGALATQGFETRVFAEELLYFTPDLMDRLAQEYDTVGLSLALNTLPRGLQVARALKRRRPDLPVIVGGASASAFADRFLGTGPDEHGGVPHPMQGAPLLTRNAAQACRPGVPPCEPSPTFLENPRSFFFFRPNFPKRRLE